MLSPEAEKEGIYTKVPTYFPKNAKEVSRFIMTFEKQGRIIARGKKWYEDK